MDEIWVLIINNEYGYTTYASDSEEKLFNILADYVDEWWDEEITSESMPNDMFEAVHQYFDWVEYEDYAIEKVKVIR